MLRLRHNRILENRLDGDSESLVLEGEAEAEGSLLRGASCRPALQARSLGRRTPGGRGTSQVTRAHVLIFERKRFSHRTAPAAAAPSVLPSPKATSSLSSQARAAFAPSVGPALSWVPNPPDSVTRHAFLSPLTSRRLPTTALSLRLPSCLSLVRAGSASRPRSLGPSSPRTPRLRPLPSLRPHGRFQGHEQLLSCENQMCSSA